MLNGTSTEEGGELMSQRLSRLGYRIVVVAAAAKPYERTTVFWSAPAGKDAARALAERFGWLSAPKPDNLSPEVAIHVVAGADSL